MLVIVPSRGRPQNIQLLLDAWHNTRTYASLLIVIDDDDPTRDEYLKLQLPDYAVMITGPRERLGPTLNRHALHTAPLYDIIGFMGDDHRPRTHAWDREFASAIAQMGGWGLAYGNDLIQGSNLPTAVWMSSRIIETLGYMVPPGMIHLYLDDFWKALGMRLQRLAYCPRVTIEHMHPIAHKAEWDEGYSEVNAGSMYENDGKVFAAYTHQQLAVDALRVTEACEK